MEDAVVDSWQERLPAKHKVIIMLSRSQVQAKTSSRTSQRETRAARSNSHAERYNRAAAAETLMYKALSRPPGKPLVFVQQEDGKITADPEVTGRRAREAWREAYPGKRRP